MLKITFAGRELRTPLAASSSPLTESLPRLRACCAAGFGAAILKTAAPYVRTGEGYGRKVVYTADGYYADSSFEREIMTLEEGLALYRGALSLDGDMLLIPSVSVNSLAAENWLAACRQFEDAGARLIQLDFFYLGTLLNRPEFPQQFSRLLTTLVQELNADIMPKLNVSFEADWVCTLMARCGVAYVSLLDSLREDPPARYGLHRGTTSYFGRRQFPITRRYLAEAVRHGFHVCAGGGIDSPADGALLCKEGAELIQTASYVLNNGFAGVPLLLAPLLPKAELMADTGLAGLRHGTWCDVEDGAICEHCGACEKREGRPSAYIGAEGAVHPPTQAENF